MILRKQLVANNPNVNFYLICFFLNNISICCTNKPRTHFIEQSGLELAMHKVLKLGLHGLSLPYAHTFKAFFSTGIKRTWN